jgi:hypothetical protein
MRTVNSGTLAVKTEYDKFRIGTKLVVPTLIPGKIMSQSPNDPDCITSSVCELAEVLAQASLRLEYYVG